MAKFVTYGQVTFESDFLFGTDDRGATIKFTRAERILLLKLSQNARAVVSRDELLDAVSGPGSDAADRNIDFVINRLRRKLGDSARKPTYIATQYGEGYVWVAERAAASTSTVGAFLVVGPIRGLRHLDQLAPLARSYAEELRASLERQTAKGSKVVLDENCPSPELFAGEKPQFAAELSFVGAGGRLDCAITLTIFGTGQILRVSRHVVAEGQSPRPRRKPGVETTATEITTAIWDALTYRFGAPATPADEPLAVRMHNAAGLLANTANWQDMQRRLRTTLENQPDDHHAKLMLATCLHSKYVTSAPFLLPQQDFRQQDEDEMEQLVLSSLPHLQDNPIYMMAAAKLLYFIDRGYRPLAIRIAEDAFRSSTAFATSFAILGQIRMLEGDIEEALSLYDRGLELCQGGSAFELYILVFKCQALLAADQRKALADTLDLLYAKESGTRALAIFFTPAGGAIVPEAQHLIDTLDRTRAKALLVFADYICGRMFRFAEHRNNFLRGPLTLLIEKFGPTVVPDDLHASVPALVAELCRGDTQDAAATVFRRTGSGPESETML